MPATDSGKRPGRRLDARGFVRWPFVVLDVGFLTTLVGGALVAVVVARSVVQALSALGRS